MRSLIAALSIIVLPLSVAPAQAGNYPDVPEPMVFDMVRPLGAKAGELEVNTLAQTRLSGPDRTVEWAPEIELAVADGFAVELELPFEGKRVTDYKVGLQGTFGTLAEGRGVHGVQYLGLYNRENARWESSALYLLGFRFDERWSMMAMAGLGDVSSGRDGGGRLLLNHSTFYDLSEASRVGVEINFKSGRGREALVMPQLHHKLGRNLSLQAGLGAAHGAELGWRPHAGVRLISEL
ncbi:hypothetical protein [Novosphingobium sp. ZW T3_23]|uniref:hypothetical protein n=1 Tax=Novosphingobium sp. ZW T3_23 TaxID=3378084 RepID=UPI003852ED9C